MSPEFQVIAFLGNIMIVKITSVSQGCDDGRQEIIEKINGYFSNISFDDCDIALDVISIILVIMDSDDNKFNIIADRFSEVGCLDEFKSSIGIVRYAGIGVPFKGFDIYNIELLELIELIIHKSIIIIELNNKRKFSDELKIFIIDKLKFLLEEFRSHGIPET